MAAGSVEKQTILIIDDSEIILEVTKSALEAAGYRVVTRSRPGGSVALLLQEKPDLVLLDVNMPTTSGDTLAAMFDKARPGSSTVILLHSTLAPDVLHAKASAVGAHGYIQKSSDLYALVRVVNRWLKPYSSSARQRVVPPVAAEDASQYSSGSLRVAKRVAVEQAPPHSGVAGRASSQSSLARIPTVLFVADDISVLSEYRRLVQTLELLAEFALSGAQALRKVEAPPAPDVIVCNAAMSDISGLELRSRLIELDTSWRRRVLLIARPGQTLPADVALIREPFTAQAIADAVREAVLHTPRLQQSSG